MQFTHILKAAVVVICCFIVFAFGIVIIPIGLGLLAIWIVALMFSEESKGESNE